MGVKFNSEKCTGCKRCVEACPGDLLALDQAGKSYIRNQADCWDCMACVKSCPVQALETRLPFSLADFGASLIPSINQKEAKWVCTHPDGKSEEFLIPK